MAPLKGVLFDYGHTLVYFPRIERTHLSAALNVQKLLMRMGVTASSSRIRELVVSTAHRQNGVVMSIEEQFAEILHGLGTMDYSPGDLRKVIHAWWEPYTLNVRPRKSTAMLLRILREAGLRLGIVANGWSSGIYPVLRRFALKSLLDTGVPSVDVGVKKPDPRICELALRDLRLRPEDVIMVGDNPGADILGAHSSGIRIVRLMRGPNRGEPDLAAPDFRIRNLSSLLPIVRTLCEGQTESS
ncbi:MAG: HAD family hydrolase [Candidatus Thorarchaeota archaeon]|jgi:HAD superfamily hydrolase (TIGR01549 family)